MPALHKYEADGGPGIERIMDVLSSSMRVAEDRRDFFKTQLVFWLLAATDGHAKNFSIVHLPGNQYRSTPLYDVLSAHPIIGTGRNRIATQRVRLAMAVRGYLINKIQRRHWIAQGRRVGLPAAQVEAMIDALTARTPEVIDEAQQRVATELKSEVVYGGS